MRERKRERENENVDDVVVCSVMPCYALPSRLEIVADRTRDLFKRD